MLRVWPRLAGRAQLSLVAYLWRRFSFCCCCCCCWLLISDDGRGCGAEAASWLRDDGAPSWPSCGAGDRDIS